MKIDEERIDQLSGLAKLRPDAEEKEILKRDLDRILGFVEKLEELDCEGITPLKHVLEEKGELRSDEIKDDVEQKDALRNAPARDSDYIKVPKFVRQQGGT